MENCEFHNLTNMNLLNVSFIFMILFIDFRWRFFLVDVEKRDVKDENHRSERA